MEALGREVALNRWHVAALGRNSKHVFADTTRIVTKLESFPTGEGYGTGATGEVWQHLEYFPFGETWANEVINNLRVPYRFTGKEFDEETKLYYFGTRYYDPRTSVWQSPDPAILGYLDGQPGNGAFEPRNLAVLMRPARSNLVCLC